VYWHNLPKDAGFPFLAMVEHTNFIPPEHFGGDHIVYCGDYLPLDHEYFRLSKEELSDRFLPALTRFNPDFRPEWVRKSWLGKAAYAQPIPTLNHSRKIPDARTPIRGLYLTNMSQVYPWDRGMNYAVRLGREAARRMIADRG
jgi:protoporphyrinogen oxidase